MHIVPSRRRSEGNGFFICRTASDDTPHRSKPGIIAYTSFLYNKTQPSLPLRKEQGESCDF
jgi:hypothetical protein